MRVLGRDRAGDGGVHRSASRTDSSVGWARTGTHACRLPCMASSSLRKCCVECHSMLHGSRVTRLRGSREFSHRMHPSEAGCMLVTPSKNVDDMRCHLGSVMTAYPLVMLSFTRPNQEDIRACVIVDQWRNRQCCLYCRVMPHAYFHTHIQVSLVHLDWVVQMMTKACACAAKRFDM